MMQKQGEFEYLKAHRDATSSPLLTIYEENHLKQISDAVSLTSALTEKKIQTNIFHRLNICIGIYNYIHCIDKNKKRHKKEAEHE